MVVPKELRCGLEVLRGWTEVLEVLGVPKGGMEMEKDRSSGSPRVTWSYLRRGDGGAQGS